MAILVRPAVVGNTDAVHDSALNPLGTRAYDANGGEYLYLKGVASCVQGAWVAIDVGADGVVVGLDTDVAGSLKSRVAIAMAAIVANKYGWFCVVSPYNGVDGLSAASATDTKAVVATSTVFVVDDAEAGAEVTVFNALYVSAESGGHATFSISNPHMHALTLD
jgi:hypothetical protein